jgi:hypothetical protein
MAPRGSFPGKEDHSTEIYTYEYYEYEILKTCANVSWRYLYSPLFIPFIDFHLFFFSLISAVPAGTSCTATARVFVLYVHVTCNRYVRSFRTQWPWIQRAGDAYLRKVRRLTGGQQPKKKIQSYCKAMRFQFHKRLLQLFI